MIRGAILLVLATFAAQQPVRDAVGARTGTGVIAGTIVADDASGKPLRLVEVALVNNGDFTRRQISATDNNGRFIFRGLPEGRFAVSASKAAYVSASYGAKKPGSSGVPIVLGAGERVDVTMKLLRGAVVTGRLTGPGGQPFVGARVAVLQFQTVNGERRLQPAGGAGNMADDQGSYRIFGVPPGEYVIQAQPTFGSTSGETTRVTAAELEWAERQFQSLGPTAPAAPVSAPLRAQTVAYAPVYYPGTADQHAAMVIKIEAGEERSGLDFAIDFVPTAKVSGVITDPDGRPPVNVQVNMLQPAQTFFASAPVFIRPDKDGKFSTSGVLPGQYVLVARGSAAPGSVPAAAPASATSVTRMIETSLPLWAMVELTIDGRDITDVAVKLQPGMTVSGRVVFEGETPTPVDDLSRIRINMSSAGLGNTVTVGAPAVSANADGTFRIAGVTPSRYRLGATFPGPPGASVWTLKSAIINGRDSQDYPFEMVGGQDISGAVITFTDRGTELTGALLDPTGRPAPEYFLVVFATNRAFWLTNSRRVKLVRPGNNGNYKLSGLPAGEYYLCALTEVQPNQINDAAFLESLISASIKLTLADGEKKTQDLKLAGGGS